MERFTISIDPHLAQEFDRLLHRRGYRNRSEAVRDLIRAELEREQGASGEGHCVANLSYVYNHHQRDLAERLTMLQHGRHDLMLATLHVHLDHENCLETAILRGSTTEVKAFATALMAEPGVRHGALHLIAVEVESGHDHDHAEHAPGAHGHWHMTPKT